MYSKICNFIVFLLIGKTLFKLREKVFTLGECITECPEISEVSRKAIFAQITDIEETISFLLDIDY